MYKIKIKKLGKAHSTNVLNSNTCIIIIIVIYPKYDINQLIDGESLKWSSLKSIVGNYSDK